MLYLVTDQVLVTGYDLVTDQVLIKCLLYGRNAFLRQFPGNAGVSGGKCPPACVVLRGGPAAP